ncbi:MAG TPA: CoA transferase [Hyphomicrobiaceae bacterium]|nr:CoA transferase [Hyphomicrobiaceae bacterium]
MYPILKGYRIVDVTTIVLGPYGTQILGDLGAEVIKVEAIEGDLNRWTLPAAEPGVGAVFANNNRNKRSLAVDLKQDAGKEVLRRLVGTSHAFVHNMRASAIERLGFSPEAVRALNPKIVYCAALGYGSDGPYSGRPAYDDIMQCSAGLAGLALMRDGEPSYHPTVTADKVAGLHVVYAVMAGLLHRERTGEGLNVEMPMFEALAAFSMNEHLMGATFEAEGSLGYGRTMSRNRRPFKTSDGWIGVLPYTREQWTRVLKMLGREDVIAEPWFPDNGKRNARSGELYQLLIDALPGRTSKEWLAAFEAADVPCGPMNSARELLEDPHLKAVGFFDPHFEGNAPIKRTLRQPVLFRDMAAEPDRAPPALGADTAVLLAELGYGAAELADLTAKRAIAGQPS